MHTNYKLNRKWYLREHESTTIDTYIDIEKMRSMRPFLNYPAINLVKYGNPSYTDENIEVECPYYKLSIDGPLGFHLKAKIFTAFYEINSSFVHQRART